MRFSWRYTLLVKDYIDRCRKRSLFYISGYTAFKDGYPLKIYLRVPLMIQIFSIIQILRHHCYREKISYPPAYLFELCCIFFSFCKKIKKKTCINHLLIGFTVILQSCQLEYGLRQPLNSFPIVFFNYEWNKFKPKREMVWNKNVLLTIY